jgi:hypothetical protein
MRKATRTERPTSAGPDITVRQPDQRRAAEHVACQGPPAQPWALFEAARATRRRGSPGRDYDDQAADRLGGDRACLALARKILTRSVHTLRELGDKSPQSPIDLLGDVVGEIDLDQPVASGRRAEGSTPSAP